MAECLASNLEPNIPKKKCLEPCTTNKNPDIQNIDWLALGTDDINDDNLLDVLENIEKENTAVVPQNNPTGQNQTDMKNMTH